MKSPPKMPQRAMVRICVASLHQKDQRRKYAGFLFYPVSQVSLSRVDSNSCGDVAEDGAKTAQCNSDDRCQRQKQGGAVGAAASRMRVPPKARRSRWEPRPGFLFILRGSRYPPAPTKKADGHSKQPSCRRKSISAHKSPHPAAAAADRVRAFFV